MTSKLFRRNVITVTKKRILAEKEKIITKIFKMEKM